MCEKEKQIAVGDVVKSCSGRTRGKLFVVVAANDKYVFLSDGQSWPISRPKKKNRKHVEGLGLRVERIGNEEIRRVLLSIVRGGNA